MKKILLSLAAVFAACTGVAAQEYMIFPPDTRTSGMGDATTAVTGDAWSIYGNAAAPLFAAEYVQAQVSWTPWQTDLRNGNTLWSVGAYYRFKERHSVAIGSRSFYMPRLSEDLSDDYPFIPKDENNNPVEVSLSRPNGRTVDLSYGYRVTNHLSLAIRAGWFRETFGTGDARQGMAFALAAYSSLPVESLGKGAKVDMGLTLSNLGFAFGDGKYRLPVTAKLGGALFVPFNDDHSIEAALDLGYMYRSKSVSSLVANVGAEYVYRKLLAVRAGYGYCNYAYATVGAGVRFSHVQVDLSYRAAAKDCPWRNTLSVALGVGF